MKQRLTYIKYSIKAFLDTPVTNLGIIFALIAYVITTALAAFVLKLFY